MPKVFISHKSEDSLAAGKIAERLRTNAVDCYLDVIDPVEVKDGPDLSNYIRSRMTECTQLMAVVSSATQNSWWVPWEIGVAMEKDFTITSFVTQTVPTIPSYLKKWPFLRTAEDIDLYARHIKTFDSRRRVEKLTESMEIFNKSAPRDVADFHRTLKRQLGQ
ncbi:TIR domain-containing protein [Azospirillum cavernae]|uniref:TIR domain-containing protein n=1 Tax=Azospirillum cavernae TaxID=2320860 RepID=A0A418W3I7_9PROT|nr:toll/interleukin-1 receptor domain-containing protein [Azospirillum cavernae]RJF84581.1 TIR domain-containing protein [Azospirillum cavernae]